MQGFSRGWKWAWSVYQFTPLSYPDHWWFLVVGFGKKHLGWTPSLFPVHSMWASDKNLCSLGHWIFHISEGWPTTSAITDWQQCTYLQQMSTYNQHICWHFCSSKEADCLFERYKGTKKHSSILTFLFKYILNQEVRNRCRCPGWDVMSVLICFW